MSTTSLMLATNGSPCSDAFAATDGESELGDANDSAAGSGSCPGRQHHQSTTGPDIRGPQQLHQLAGFTEDDDEDDRNNDVEGGLKTADVAQTAETVAARSLGPRRASAFDIGGVHRSAGKTDGGADKQAGGHAASAAAGSNGLACILCMDCIGTRDELQHHLLTIHKVKPETLHGILRLVGSIDDRINGSSSSDPRPDRTSPPNAPTSHGDPHRVQEDSSSNLSQNQPSVSSSSRSDILRMTGAHEEALRLAVEASKDGIIIPDKGTSSDASENVERLCHTCSQSFTSIDALYAHQNELGHLELAQTPTGPGYLCWHHGCQQYFRTAAKLQEHHKEAHVTPPLSEYAHHCKHCQLAFRSADRLHMHSYCHEVQQRSATDCLICGQEFGSVDAVQRHVDAFHLGGNGSDLERYRDSLAAASSLALLGGASSALTSPTAHTPGSSNNDTDKNIPKRLLSKENEAGTMNEDGVKHLSNLVDHGSVDMGSCDRPRSKFSDIIEDYKLDENSNSNISDTLVSDGPTVNSSWQKDPPAYIPGVPIIDGEYSSLLKFKCHRCKVGFAKMNQLSAHNRTPEHRQGSKSYSPPPTPVSLVSPPLTPVQSQVPASGGMGVSHQALEKYRDPNRPFKCDVCRESFTQKNILLVHNNSVSHLHRLKKQQLQSVEITRQQNDADSLAGGSAIESVRNDEEHTSSDRLQNESVSALDVRLVDDRRGPEGGLCDARQETIIADKVTVVARQDVAVVGENGNTYKSDAMPSTHELVPSASSAPFVVASSSRSQPATTVSAQKDSITTAAATTLIGSHGEKSDAGNIDRRAASHDSQTPRHHQVSKQSSTIGHGVSSHSVPPTQLNHQQQPQQHQPSMSMANAIQQQQMQMLLSDMFQQQLMANPSMAAFLPPELLASMFPQTSAASAMPAQPPGGTHKVAMAPSDKAQRAANTPSTSLNPEQHHQRTSAHVCYQCGAVFGSTEHLQQHMTMHSAEAGSNTRLTTVRPEVAVSASSGTSAFKSRIQQVLLESFGFECVMQFNEFRQRTKKNTEEPTQLAAGSEVEQKEANNVEETESSQSMKPDEEKKPDQKAADAKTSNLPELQKSKCKQCSKEFSSIWVLKAHEEEVHSAVLPAETVTEFASQLRKIYENRRAAAVAAANASAASHDTKSSSAEISTARPSRKPDPPPPVVHMPQTDAVRMPRVTSSQLAADLAAMQHAAAQLMQFPLMMGMMGTPPPPPGMMPMMLPLGAELFGFPPGFAAAMMDPTMMMLNQQQPPHQSQQQQQQQQQRQVGAVQQQANAAAGVQQKSARTRINDEQLAVLRAHFDINNSPSEEQIRSMSERTGLPPKVIKHWFRNTLFKERQRNKDSPYNFSVPPATTLNLDDYERTAPTIKRSQPDSAAKNNSEPPAKIAAVSAPLEPTPTPQKSLPPVEKKETVSPAAAARKPMPTITAPVAPIVNPALFPEMSAAAAFAASMSQMPPVFAPLNATIGLGGIPIRPQQPTSQPPTQPQPMPITTPVQDSHSHERRANRTRFTNRQIQILQECFEKNAYPKDDELEALSRLLDLSPRVIVVWFQNARQKVRKNYENQVQHPGSGPTVSNDSGDSTPGLSLASSQNGEPEYRCKRCSTVFPHFFDLDKHQRTVCYPEESVSFMADSDSSQDEQDGSDNDASQSSVGSEPRPGGRLPSSSGIDYRCDKCDASFGNIISWNEHQMSHASSSQLNQALDATKEPSKLAGDISKLDKTSAAIEGLTVVDESLGQRQWMSDDGSGDDPRNGSGNGGDKRMRTTILPEQLDYLYHKYQSDCNPSRKQLDAIAAHVGLKKRVVQVWFQNTRARERKGQYRAHQQLIHKRCPFCKALFRARTALEAHLATKHPDEMARSDVNVDSIPDEIPDLASPLSSPPISSLASPKLANGPFAGVAASFLAAASPATMPPRPPGPGDLLQANMQRLYEDSFRRYIDELSHISHPAKLEPMVPNMSTDYRLDLPSSTPAKPKVEDGPLDLSTSSSVRAGSTSVEPGREDVTGGNRHGSSLDDNRSESRSENNDDFSVDYSVIGDGSNPASPGACGSQGKSGGTPGSAQYIPGKRYRTQMSSMQIRVMKAIFQDYRTPTMSECEVLGREISLPRRVVQVWFQNARAKEKKIGLPCTETGVASAAAAAAAAATTNPTPDSCELCAVHYTSQHTIQDHLFTRSHIDRVKLLVCNHRDSTSSLSDENRMGDSSGQIRHRRHSSSRGDDMSGQMRSGMLLTPPVASPSNVPNADRRSMPPNAPMSSTANKVKQESGLPSKTQGNAAQDPSAGALGVNLQSAAMAAQLLGPYAAAAGFPMGNPNDIMGMMPYFYPGLATGFFPGGGIPGMPFMQPSLMPGAEFMYDPANFGTPLTLLQIPARSIQRIQEKLTDNECVLTYYSQDCRHFSDLQKAVSADDWVVARRAFVDVGYICRRCHIVYPGRNACTTHQETMCYQDAMGSSSGSRPSIPANSIVKLEQMQYECLACRSNPRFSTASEYKTHSATDAHKAAAAAWIRARSQSRVASSTPVHSAVTTSAPVSVAAVGAPTTAPASAATASDASTNALPVAGDTAVR